MFLQHYRKQFIQIHFDFEVAAPRTIYKLSKHFKISLVKVC